LKRANKKAGFAPAFFSLTADVSVSGADEGRCSFCVGRFFDDVIGRRQIPSSRVLHSTLRVLHVKPQVANELLRLPLSFEKSLNSA
jgi:hypothetical protein